MRNIMGSFNHNEQSLRVVERLEKGGQGLNLCAEVRDGILCHRSHLKAKTLEGVVVRYADKIAYLNHDIEDAMRAGLLPNEQAIPLSVREVLGETSSSRFTVLVSDLVEQSQEKAEISMSEPVLKAYNELRDFMFAAVYRSKAKDEEQKVMYILEGLYRYYEKNPDSLPEEYRMIADEEGKERAVCDYISGMSDRFAVRSFEELFVPKSWSVG